MVTILTISTITFLILFLHASYLYQKETEKVEELNNDHTLSNNYWMIEEQKLANMQEQVKQYMAAFDAVKGGN